MDRDYPIKNFFETYALVSMRPEPAPHANLYANEFIAAAPSGSAAYKNDDQFLEWLNQVYDFNEKTGLESIQVMSVHENPITNEYSLATVEWGAKYEKTGGELIHFKITYLLQFLEDQPHILAYIDHEDQQKVMKERGILAD
jgi:hypothetical protein